MDTSKLKNRDYVLVIDKSGSMTGTDCPGGLSRWKSAQETTLAIASKANEYDPDGITVIPFAGTFKTYDNVTPSKVADVFAENEPLGGTILSPVLESVFASYLKQKAAGTAKENGVLCLVITDGQPTDEDQVAKTIVAFTKKLDTREEFGLAFFQVGKDQHASDFLKRLDDNLKSEGAKHDIVDAKTMEEIKAVLNKYDIMGTAILASPSHSEFLLHPTATWSVCRWEGPPANGVLRFRSKREDFKTKEEQDSVTEATVHGIESIRWLSMKMHDHMTQLVGMLRDKMNVLTNVAGIMGKPDSVPGDGK